MDASFKLIPIGTGEVVYQTSENKNFDFGLIAIGNQVYPAIEVAKTLKVQGLELKVINARFVKPLDSNLILETAKQCTQLVTIEENDLPAGFGSAVLELLNDHQIQKPVLRLGIPDEFITHGTQTQLQEEYGLDVKSMAKKILEKVGQKTFA
jgi:1-deoxy-D-xylulose-5-phosphate synthase